MDRKVKYFDTSVVGSSGRQQGLSGYAVSPYVSAGSSHQSTFFGRSCSAASPSNGLALCGPAEPETQNYNQEKSAASRLK